MAAWSLRGDGEATVGDLDLEFVGGNTVTADGVAFDGLTGSALTKGPSPLDTTDSLTLSAWVSYHDALVDQPIVVGLAGATNLSVAFGVYGSDWIFGTSERDVPGAASGGALISGPEAVRSDSWVHLVGVSDRDAELIRFYVNGELADEVSAADPFAASGPLIIGGGLETGHGGWAGAVANVAAYQIVLTADQITVLYQTTRPTAPPPKWTPDPATYGEGILNGTWDYVIQDDIDSQLKVELETEYGRSFDEARIRFGFDGARWWQGHVLDGELQLEDSGFPSGDGGTFRVDGGELMTTAWYGTLKFAWTLDESGLTLRLLEECTVESGHCVTDHDEIEAQDPFAVQMSEHTYTKSGDDASF
ncbi:MAG: LamG domain-containing protein [Candidatus Limnocylindrales bacterium]